MRKFTLLLAFAFIFTTGWSQQVPVSEEQWSLLTKKTATWCPNCGTWGWDMFKGVIENTNDENLISMATHFSGDLQNQVSIDISDNFGGSGQPLFYLNGDELGVSNGNASAKITETVESIGLLNGLSPFAGVGVDAYVEDNVLNVNASVKAFADFNADFHLGIYLIRDNYIYNQAGNSSSASHLDILVDKIGAESFGENIVTGDIATDDVFDVSVEYTGSEFDVANIENYKVAAVLWNKSAKYIFFNGNVDTEIQIISNNSNSEISETRMMYMPVKHALVIDTEDISAVESFIVYDTNGKVVLTKNNAIEQINALPEMVAGSYIATIQIQGKLLTKKFIVN